MGEKISESGNKCKKIYQAPKLESVSVIEAGSQLCCKASTAACKATNQTSQGKSRRTSVSS